ncbi:MAG: hypothetical protein PHW82_12230 [Bacteroidales bacterium]|nr:hypothetical protein [Bacteroidales bacterium]
MFTILLSSNALLLSQSKYNTVPKQMVQNININNPNPTSANIYVEYAFLNNSNNKYVEITAYKET